MKTLTLEEKVDALYNLFFEPKEYYSQDEFYNAIEALRNGDKKPLMTYFKKGGIAPGEKEVLKEIKEGN